MNAQLTAHYLANRYPERLIIINKCNHNRKKIKHHPDYDKPYEIELICHKCHGQYIGPHTKSDNIYNIDDYKDLSFCQLLSTKPIRKELLRAGYKPARISMWASGDRHPTYETAQEIAALLKISLETIPWVKWVKNI